VSTSSGIDNRKDLLLLVLAAQGGAPVVGVTRLQKYLYLLQDQEGWGEKLGSSRYQFRAYDFGPFDDQLYADLDFLENLKLIAKQPAGEEPLSESGEEQQASESWGTSDPEFAPWAADQEIWAYRLTDKGREFVEKNLALDADEAGTIERMKERWNGTPLTQFLRWLYTTYPEVAENTKLTHLRST
jgi:uncharacterized protein